MKDRSSLFLFFFAVLRIVHCQVNGKILGRNGKPVNILLILADDLGFGDTSVAPFIGSGILTPNLQKMASKGAVLSNFHSAATTCTPSRAAILTGMYPWRLGIKAVFEYGAKGNSNRDDWLLQVPTVPMVFSEANYNTFHSGKWHVGGMRNDDYDMRRLKDKEPGAKGGKRCPHPGPNQQGFQNYISVLDGPGAPRQNHLQIDDTLYSQGCNSLLFNDIPVTQQMFNISGYLTYCEAMHAMRAMTDSVKEKKPFYMHLWFHAPHGPWEEIPGYSDWYDDVAYPKSPNDAHPCGEPKRPGTRQPRYCATNVGPGKKRIEDRGMSRFAKYRSMVSDMDRQIGMVLDHIASLGIEEETLIFFTSDNGYEDDAGGAGGLRGNKRHVYEGGIRVPAIAQWVGTIPARSIVPTPAVNTDLYATFLDAANIPLPSHVLTDGISLLPDLLQASKYPLIASHDITLNTPALKEGAKQAHEVTVQAQHHQRHKQFARFQQSTERLMLWHNDYEGPRRTVASMYEYKILLNEEEIPFEMFDLRVDINEERNLIGKLKKNDWLEMLKMSRADIQKQLKLTSLTRLMVMKNRADTNIHIYLVWKLYPHMLEYVRRGDEGYRTYLSHYPELRYPPSPLSDNRPMRSNVFRLYTPQAANVIRDKLMAEHSCRTTAPCSCAFVSASTVPALPFPLVYEENRWTNVTMPVPFFNSSIILFQ